MKKIIYFFSTFVICTYIKPCKRGKQFPVNIQFPKPLDIVASCFFTHGNYSFLTLARQA